MDKTIPYSIRIHSVVSFFYDNMNSAKIAEGGILAGVRTY